VTGVPAGASPSAAFTIERLEVLIERLGRYPFTGTATGLEIRDLAAAYESKHAELAAMRGDYALLEVQAAKAVDLLRVWCGRAANDPMDSWESRDFWLKVEAFLKSWENLPPARFPTESPL
jgi:hypothetical protein